MKIADPAAVIALWLGHEQIETTQIYLHADPQIKERALERHDRFLRSGNRWRAQCRAQRYGVRQGLIDFGPGEIVPMGDLLEEDAAFSLFGRDGGRPRHAARPRQRRATARHSQGCAQGRGRSQPGARPVVRHLIEEFQADL